MGKDLYVGVDMGTTVVKAGLFDAQGRQLALATREFHLETPAAGFAEFDADSYIECAFDAVREVIASPDADAHAVRAIGLSSQAQTFVLLGRDDRPLRPAVSWLDVRAEAEAKELSRISLRAGGEAVNAIDSGPKILWLLRHEPAAVKQARRMFVIPDYFIFKLTGRAVTDPATAFSTAFYDWRRGRRLEAIISACALRLDALPEVLLPGEAAGKLSARASRRLGLARDVVVAVGTNDQYAGALGAGNVIPGCASLTLGTALAIVITSEHAGRLPRGVEVSPHPARGLFAVLAYAKTAGIVVRWFRDNFAPSLSYDGLFREAAGVPIGADGLCCIPHFSGMASPTFDPSARGAFAGLTLAHGRAHVARAIIESLSFCVRENLDLLRPAVGGVKELRAIGGGAKSDFWLQMVADVAGVTVERPVTREAACLGAAELAMTATGRFNSVAEAARSLYRAERRFEPDVSVKSAYDSTFERYRKLCAALCGGRGKVRRQSKAPSSRRR